MATARVLVRSVALALLVALAGCAAPPRPANPYAHAPPDPRVFALLEQYERALREARAELAQPRPDALAAIGQARMSLASSAQGVERAHEESLARVIAARRAVEALAGSDRERAQVARAELDLSEGKDSSASLPERVREHAAYRELVLAHAALAKSEEAARMLRAQSAALDSVLAWLVLGASKTSPRSARDIDPDLGP
jgi:hypothetical protein